MPSRAKQFFYLYFVISMTEEYIHQPMFTYLGNKRNSSTLLRNR